MFEKGSTAIEGLSGRARAGFAATRKAASGSLRDLVRVFESLADNAQAFMAGVARSIDLQQGGAAAVAIYKRRLIDYLERFMIDLVRRSDAIARHIRGVAPPLRTCCGLWPIGRRAMRPRATSGS